MVLSQLQFSLFVNAAQLAVRIVSASHNFLRVVGAISFWLLSEQLFKSYLSKPVGCLLTV